MSKADQPDHNRAGSESIETSVADLQLPETVLVTGFPGFIARRLVAKILASDTIARVYLVCQPGPAEQAREFLAGLPGQHGERAELVIGDAADMDLGLAGSEYCNLAGEVTTIHHLSGSEPAVSDRHLARRLDVGGTRGIIELAEGCTGLRRLCHWSTAAVSGKRKGIILEEELDEGQSFHSIHEETKFQAEKLAQFAGRRLPVTVFRPGIVIGDSKSGEFDKLDGPHYLMFLIATNPTQVSLPLPGRGSRPLNLTPVDYVVDAAYALSRDERAAGKTFHLTDPNPLSARRIYELVAEHSHTKPPRGYIPGRITRSLLRVPGLEDLARGPLSFLDALDHHAVYNCRLTQELLADSGLRCPPFDSYVDKIIHRIRELQEIQQQPSEDDDYDALD
ncbi:MAG: SDR family oxidoreductase [Proteobacteria bacterium]|nr:SDR family oxidoreductase [Pseudomonadota bacterium]